jgi:non-heme chloroperoxidase
MASSVHNLPLWCIVQADGDRLHLTSQGGTKAHYDGILAFSQTDFTRDLNEITVPTCVMHGDDDQIVPYADSAPLTAKLLKNAALKTYKGFPHGMITTQANTLNPDILAFIRS